MKYTALKLFLSVFFLFGTSSVGFATSPIAPQDDQLCLEEAANGIIDFLTKDEPKSDLHIVKDEEGNVVSIVDVNRIYPTFDFSAVYRETVTTRTVEFRDGDYILLASIDTSVQSHGSSCKVTNVESGQDDQD